MTEHSDLKDTEALDRPRDWLPWLFWPLFIVVISLIAFWMATKPTSQMMVPVPAHDISAYHLLTAGDLTTKTIDTALISSDFLRQEAAVIDHYAVEPLTAGIPIRTEQIQAVSDLQLITGTMAIGIPATPAMALGGKLQAGDVVDIIFVSVPNDAQPKPTPTRFEHLLVLDVKSVVIEKAVEDDQPHQPYVIVIALPLDKRDEFVARSATETMMLTRHNPP